MTLPDLPRLGLGTWDNTDSEECAETVRTALEMGYRHIDTAQSYDNEASVGEGIARADVSRDEIFLATKVATGNLSHDDVLDSTEQSLERLGVDTIDLMYVHWPTGTYDAADTLPAFDELRDRGWIEHVGLSNFEPDQLDEARDILDAPIAANQVEMHPLLHQDELVKYAREHDHWVVAYSPIARAEVFDVPELSDIAGKHGVSEAQVALAWLLSMDNVAAIPKATGDHVRENWAAREVDLDPEDVERIDAIDREYRVVNPSRAPWNR